MTTARSFFLIKLFKTKFGKTLLFFLLCQVVFILITRVEFLQNIPVIKEHIFYHGVENALTALFMASVYFLVLLNTLIFISESLTPFTRLGDLEDNINVQVKNNYILFILSLVVSVFMAGLMTYVIGESLFSRIDRNKWILMLEVNEFISIILYSLFLFADLRCLKACEIALGNNSGLNDRDRVVFKCFQAEVKTYILACDAPGLFGIVLIVLLSLTLHSVLAGLYWQGFLTGAIGLHMAFSQSALAFLSTKEAE